MTLADDQDDMRRAQAAKRSNPFLNTEQAAAYLGVSARKLQQMRASCSGPPYRLHSRFIRYHIDDIDFWSRSTSMTGAGAKASPPGQGPDPDAAPEANPDAAPEANPGRPAADARDPSASTADDNG